MNAAALAFCSDGLWKACCPRPHCGNAEALCAWQSWFACSNKWCRAQAPVEWPPDLVAISEVLYARGNPEWMNWFPLGHPVAVAGNCPHGQTVADLQAETMEHLPELAEWYSFGAVGGAPPIFAVEG